MHFNLAGFFVSPIYMIEVAKSHGISVTSASFLISALGVANLLGRLAAGAVVSYKVVGAVELFIGSCVVGGLATVACPHLDSMPLLVTYSIIYGLFTGKLGFSINHR
jgi:MCP family monocarboxylic acid transporter-like MFS transporter 13/MCP family monocarboxylic acid transporter-like MFS transporter 12